MVKFRHSDRNSVYYAFSAICFRQKSSALLLYRTVPTDHNEPIVKCSHQECVVERTNVAHWHIREVTVDMAAFINNNSKLVA